MHYVDVWCRTRYVKGGFVICYANCNLFLVMVVCAQKFCILILCVDHVIWLAIAEISSLSGCCVGIRGVSYVVIY